MAPGEGATGSAVVGAGAGAVGAGGRSVGLGDRRAGRRRERELPSVGLGEVDGGEADLERRVRPLRRVDLHAQRDVLLAVDGDPHGSDEGGPCPSG